MENHDLYARFRHLGGLLRHSAHQGGHHGRPGGPEGPWADPTRGQGRILATLKLQDGVSTKDLAFILGLRVASLNELLGKLEKAEYVTREQSPEDRRVSLIRLTEKGRQAQQEQSAPEDAFSVLSEEERAALAASLDKVIAKLEEAHGADHAERFQQWAEEARSRMGEERFDEWMGKFRERFGEDGPTRFGRGGFGGPRGGFDPRQTFGGSDAFGGNDREDRGRSRHGHRGAEHPEGFGHPHEFRGPEGFERHGAPDSWGQERRDAQDGPEAESR